MRKYISIIAILMLIFSLTSCTPKEDDVDTDNETGTETSSTEKKELTEEDFEQIAASALYNEISTVHSDSYDPSQVRYNVGSIQKDEYMSNSYDVMGKVYLYDYYGNCKSIQNFTVNVSSTGYVFSTVIHWGS